MEEVTRHEAKHFVGVAVITPKDSFPSEDDFRRIDVNEKVETLLREVAHKLKLTNTSDWVAKIGDRILDVNCTYKELGLKCLIEIEWHKGEGGGGA